MMASGGDLKQEAPTQIEDRNACVGILNAAGPTKIVFFFRFAHEIDPGKHLLNYMQSMQAHGDCFRRLGTKYLLKPG